jgi:hypothetical protein
VKRRLFTILAALSLLLFVVIAVVCARSFLIYDVIEYRRVDGRGEVVAAWSVASALGRVVLSASDPGKPRLPQLDGRRWAAVTWDDVNGSLVPDPVPPKVYNLHWWRFDWRAGGRTGSDGNRYLAAEVIVPYWFLALVTLLPAGSWLRRGQRLRRRRTRGLCPRCGYDLRATPERCPECGAVPAQAPT